MKNMEGNNFNNKLFNKIYQDNRLYTPDDDGYNNWIDDNNFESDKINRTLSSYDKNNFNNVFSNLNRKKVMKYRNTNNLKQYFQIIQIVETKKVLLMILVVLLI